MASTTVKADHGRAARQLLAERLTQDRASAPKRMAKDLGEEWQVLVLQLPGDAKGSKTADSFKTPKVLDAAGRSPDVLPEAEDMEDEGCEHGETPKSLPEDASRTQEICRRLRQLADDLEALEPE